MIYIIEMDLGPTYSIRLPAAGELLEGKKTIDLTDEEVARYNEALAVTCALERRLHNVWRSQ
jgi:hypothetical protein